MRNCVVFAENITPIDFCGKPIMWELNGIRVYELPYETESTRGEHDFNTCENCQKNLQYYKEAFQLRFNGTKEKVGFPLCCNGHKELAEFEVFDINDFKQVPDWTAKKIIYTIQHIINNISADNYYQEITDYIDYTIDSFGKTPNDSEPLYLFSYYLPCISEFISNSDEGIPKDRKDRLLKYLNFSNTPKESTKADLNILVKTYEAWFKIFPWQISFFVPLKPQFEKKLPIIQSVSHVNKYSGKVIAKPHTKNSLIEILINTTDDILTEINNFTFYEKGLLTDPQKAKLELVVNEMRLKVQQGYTNTSPYEEQRYRNIIKAWFADQKKFIDELTPLLPALQHNNAVVQINTATVASALPSTKERTINVEGLKPYFTAVFKGMGNGNINYFDHLVEGLKANRNAKDYACIASMIYYGGKMNNEKPKTFAAWYRIFCGLIECDCKKYQPKDLKPYPDNLRNLFSYLE